MITEIEIPLSIIATAIATLSFCGEGWRLWRDRPRLTFYLRPITFKNVPHFGDMKMVQILVCNVGYRPIILTRFAAYGEKSSFHMGVDDEPAAALGVEDQKFPVLIEPGATIKIHPIGYDALKRNFEKPSDEKTFHDPYLYFFIFDSFNRMHHIDLSLARWHLRLSDHYSKPKWLHRLGLAIKRSRIKRRARKEVRRWT